ncbi:hypothetical protein BDV93DRAFT_601763 [Ceratobasidium sp. AG-I]|nr:hypothetical protein BDV93DRAFT_601763 [Ceratobasidium sp. AG-I]
MSAQEIDDLAQSVFETMLEDVVLGIALDEHKAGLRNRAVCAVCHTRCRLEEHINQGTSTGTPGSGAAATNGNGLGNGNGNKQEPVVLLDCIKCKRQASVTPNRYASHLATCMGLGTARRTGPRNATSKGRNGADAGPATPLQRSGSANGAPSEDQATATPPSKAKASKKKKKADTPESTNGNNKREGAAPAKPSKAKKQKVGKAANGKPLTFQAANLEEFATPASVPSPPPAKLPTASRVPSKLQNSQTPISPAASSTTTPTHTPQILPATIPPATGAPAPQRVVRGTGPPRPLLGRGPSIPRTNGVTIEKPPPPPTRQSSTSHSRTDADGDQDDLVDTASDSSDDT